MMCFNLLLKKKQTGKPLSESRMSEHTDELMVQLWMNLVRPHIQSEIIFLTVVCFSASQTGLSVLQMQPSVEQQETENNENIFTLLCPDEVKYSISGS